MTQALETLMEQALALPEKDRAQVAGRLLLSLEEEDDPDPGELWRKEIARRMEDLKQGRVYCEPWDRVRNRLAERIGAKP